VCAHLLGGEAVIGALEHVLLLLLALGLACGRGLAQRSGSWRRPDTRQSSRIGRWFIAQGAIGRSPDLVSASATFEPITMATCALGLEPDGTSLPRGLGEGREAAAALMLVDSRIWAATGDILSVQQLRPGKTGPYVRTVDAQERVQNAHSSPGSQESPILSGTLAGKGALSLLSEP
jgi:hypothetical protein